MDKYTEHKKKLNDELNRITKELEGLGEQNAESGDWIATPNEKNTDVADPNLEADSVEDWNERRALVAELEIRYRNVKRSLDKIEAGTYGVCEISGEKIELERLEVNPAARTNLENIDREKELPV